MSSEQSFANDDENDTLLFERWEAHVIEKYPNPQRIGCPSREALESFVDKPESMSLAGLNDTHITKCRECILTLKDLRRLREERLRKSASPRHREYWTGWRVAVAAACTITAVFAFVVWQRSRDASPALPTNEEVVGLTIDLSGDGVTRSPGVATNANPFSLPRRIVDLDLVMPYFSPSGDYDFTVVKGENSGVLETARATAVANGPHTRAHLRLDLRRLSSGRYYLGTSKRGESATYFYPFTLN